MGALKLAPDLEAADLAFAQNTEKLAAVFDRVQDDEVRQLMSNTVDSMIALAQAFKVALGTPKYHTTNTYGPRIQQDQHNAIESVQELNTHKTVNHQHNTTFNQVNAVALAGDWFYWLSPNLIINTSGTFEFYPKDRKIRTQLGERTLTENEAQELFRVLKQDYKLRGTL